MSLSRIAALTLLAVLLSSCSSQPPDPQPAASAPATKPAPEYPRPHRDGAPWWDMDVTRIQDAIPVPHTGRYKASTYSVMGKTYHPMQDGRNYRETGTASWYGTKFHGQATANGEHYDLYGMTAAHKTLPLPTYVRVTSLENGRSIIVRVNDRGPFYSDRIIDLSFAAAKKLGFAETGTARVRVEGIDPQQWQAENGHRVPMLMAGQQPVVSPQPVSAPLSSGQIEEYQPPLAQHAAPVLPNQLAAANPAGATATGLFLQVGAFANPDAAELLKDKLGGLVSAPAFIDSVMINQQILHRVRLGPIGSPAEMQEISQSVRLANLGQPTPVAHIP
jgi:rare lipoprotein A